MAAIRISGRRQRSSGVVAIIYIKKSTCKQTNKEGRSHIRELGIEHGAKSYTREVKSRRLSIRVSKRGLAEQSLNRQAEGFGIGLVQRSRREVSAQESVAETEALYSKNL